MFMFLQHLWHFLIFMRIIREKQYLELLEEKERIPWIVLSLWHYVIL